ncbi:MAG: phosphoribosylglycinamide formyltransferase [Pseudomonadota bacterium]
MAEKKRVGVMISGRGSNLQALIDAAQDPTYPAELVLVVSNRPDAQGLSRAEAAGIRTLAIDHRSYPDRPAFEAEVTKAFQAAQVDLIAQAGFMRILTDGFVNHWLGRMINIHPSLLPSFPGLNTHQRALDAGVKLHGCSVHYVFEEVDGGPLIGQAAVPVLPGDSADSLAARVLAAEHRLYPHCLALVAGGQAQLVQMRVEFSELVPAQGTLISPQPPVIKGKIP